MMINNMEYGDTYNKQNTETSQIQFCIQSMIIATRTTRELKKKVPGVKICWNDTAALVYVTEEESFS